MWVALLCEDLTVAHCQLGLDVGRFNHARHSCTKLHSCRLNLITLNPPPVAVGLALGAWDLAGFEILGEPATAVQ